MSVTEEKLYILCVKKVKSTEDSELPDVTLVSSSSIATMIVLFTPHGNNMNHADKVKKKTASIHVDVSQMNGLFAS